MALIGSEFLVNLGSVGLVGADLIVFQDVEPKKVSDSDNMTQTGRRDDRFAIRLGETMPLG